jgi:uncharacterized protein YndB with AHSA1/START domain
MASNTVRLHRVLQAAPDLVYRAFLDPGALCKWLPPHGFVGHVQQMDARVGGSYKMSFTALASGQSHSFGGRYLELKPGELIRYTNVFDDPNLPGEMLTTITLRAVFCGTELTAEQQGIPAAIPVEACYLGWQQSLALLALLVEAPVPG